MSHVKGAGRLDDETFGDETCGYAYVSSALKSHFSKRVPSCRACSFVRYTPRFLRWCRCTSLTAGAEVSASSSTSFPPTFIHSCVTSDAWPRAFLDSFCLFFFSPSLLA